ncbi:hypothetical protein CAS74_002362 [Pichia kudriavzevii]|uniref:Uncharacterized protein n=1 Tax=Pichia kudriavzevii TaxID=4909 RepID=A0A1Z8JPU3_PICKU|nr:hypothetical protein CAS74_002362 [Pichia kudriavzevii]
MDELEGKAIVHLQKCKYAEYKKAISQFRLFYPELFKRSCSKPVLNYRIKDLLITETEVELFIFNGSVVADDAVDWTDRIMDVLEIPRESRHERSKRPKMIKYKENEKSMADISQSVIEETITWTCNSTGIGDFGDEFHQNKQYGYVFSEIKKSHVDGDHFLYKYQKPKRLPVPLKELKATRFDEWECPTFNM